MTFPVPAIMPFGAFHKTLSAQNNLIPDGGSYLTLYSARCTEQGRNRRVRTADAIPDLLTAGTLERPTGA